MRRHCVWLFASAVALCLSLGTTPVRAEPKVESPAAEKPKSETPIVEKADSEKSKVKEEESAKKKMSDEEHQQMMKKKQAGKEMSDDERMMMKKHADKERTGDEQMRMMDEHMSMMKDMMKEKMSDEEMRRKKEEMMRHEMQMMHMGNPHPAMEPRMLRIFAIEHNEASNLAGILAPMLQPGGYIAPDKHSNKLVVFAPEEALRLVRDALHELDVPARDRMRPPMGEPGRMDPPRMRPSFEYEREMDRRPDERRPDDRRPDMERRDREPDRPMDMRRDERPDTRYRRTEATLIRKGEKEIVIQPNRSDETMTLAVPTVQRDNGEWEPKGGILEQIRELDKGASVVVDWWEAEGTKYVEGIRLLRNEREMKETFILERDAPEKDAPAKDEPHKDAPKKSDDAPDTPKPDEK